MSYRHILFVVVAVLAVAVQASANTVTYSGWYPTLNGPTPADTPRTSALTDWDGVSQSISLPRFDTSLGTLNSVTLTLYSDLDSSGYVKNDSPGTITVNQYDAYLRTRILAPGTSTPATLATAYLLNAAPTLVSLAPQDLNPGDSVSFDVVESSASASHTYTSSLDMYEGTGTNVFPLFTKTQTISDLTGGNLDLTQITSVRSEAVIVYNYTPVPEPSTIILLGMSAIGLLAYARRQRRK